MSRDRSVVKISKIFTVNVMNLRESLLQDSTVSVNVWKLCVSTF